MTGIPRAALVLGLAGLAPFVWGAASALLPVIARPINSIAGARFSGLELLVDYGVIILCFMGGALWGFAARGSDRLSYVFGVLPALWVLFSVGESPQDALRALIGGFIGILLLDLYFWVRRLAPRWWMALRLILTAVVVPCLVLGLYHG